MRRSARPARKRRRPYHHGNLRRALLDDARHYPHGRRRRADTAGNRRPTGRFPATAFTHFAGKPSLLEAVATKGSARCARRSSPRGRRAACWRAGFDAMGLDYVRFAVTNPAHYRVNVSAGSSTRRRRRPSWPPKPLALSRRSSTPSLHYNVTRLCTATTPATTARFVWAVWTRLFADARHQWATARA